MVRGLTKTIKTKIKFFKGTEPSTKPTQPTQPSGKWSKKIIKRILLT